MQPHPDVSGYEPLGALHIGVEVGPVGGEPKAVVDHVGVFLGDAGLGAGLVLGQGHGFQRGMGRVQHRGRRAFVDLPGLDAHQPVLHVVDAPHAVGTGQSVQVTDQIGPGHGLAVHRRGHAALEMNLDAGRFIGCAGHGTGPGVGVFGGFQPGVLQFSSLHAPAPQVLVGGEPAAVGVDGQVARLAVFDLFIPAHAPVTYGSDDLDVRPQRGDADLQPDLVVALAGAAVGDGVGVVLPRRLHQVTGDQRPSQGRGQRILFLVDRPGLKGREQELVHQGFPAIDGQGFHGADLQRPLADGLQVHHAQVNGQGDYVGVVLLLQPRDRHGGVQSTAVGQHDFWLCHCLVLSV